MFSKKTINKNGFTLVEILVVIGIMATLSVLFIVSIKTSDKQRFSMTVDNLANDMRYIRNLAVSRTVYNDVYPGKYGIKITNGNGTTQASRYILYAGSEANILKSVTFSDVKFRIGDFNASSTIAQNNWSANFEFIDENKINELGMTISPAQQYQLFLQYPVTDGNQRAVLLIGEQSKDNFIWANIGYYDASSDYDCGDGVVDPNEQCDDGDSDNSNGCRNNCTFGGGGGGGKFVESN